MTKKSSTNSGLSKILFKKNMRITQKSWKDKWVSTRTNWKRRKKKEFKFKKGYWSFRKLQDFGMLKQRLIKEKLGSWTRKLKRWKEKCLKLRILQPKWVMRRSVGNKASFWWCYSELYKGIWYIICGCF